MISGIAGIVAWVIGIVVLIRLFQKGGLVQGLIGIITCQIWTFIWGWRHAKEENLTTIMWVWTGIIVVSAIVSVVFGGAGAGGGGGELPTPEATQEGLRIISRLFM
jgi:hypothetical protein